ncbi:hypothetical protein AVEN_200130-1, partial [Araneus ventricosus]
VFTPRLTIGESVSKETDTLRPLLKKISNSALCAAIEISFNRSRTKFELEYHAIPNCERSGERIVAKYGMFGIAGKSEVSVSQKPG